MSRNVFHCSIRDLGRHGSSWQTNLLPPDSFHYTSVGCGGWGIIRVGLLVPESALLFVGPSGCGRHGAIAGIHCGFKKNLAFLHVTETDIVTGARLPHESDHPGWQNAAADWDDCALRWDRRLTPILSNWPGR